jgi:hypothetical protein
MQKADLILACFFGAVTAACILIVIYQRLYIRWHWRVKNKAPKPSHDNIILTCSFIAIVALISLITMVM